MKTIQIFNQIQTQPPANLSQAAHTATMLKWWLNLLCILGRFTSSKERGRSL